MNIFTKSRTFCRRHFQTFTLRWRHNGHGGVWNHQPYHCLLNRLVRRRSNKTSKLRITGLCAGNSPGAGEFPAQMASNAENVSIWWRHHVSMNEVCCILIHISWKFVFRCPIYNNPALVQIMVWCRTSYYLNQRWHSLLAVICAIQQRWDESAKYVTACSGKSYQFHWNKHTLVHVDENVYTHGLFVVVHLDLVYAHTTYLQLFLLVVL